MNVLLIDRYQGIEFDEEIRVQGFDYCEVMDTRDHLITGRKDGRSYVALAPHIVEWVEANCAGQAILAMERDDFLIAFNDLSDAMLFRTRFA